MENLTSVTCREQTRTTRCVTPIMLHTKALSVINWRPTTVASLSHWASTYVDNTCHDRRTFANFF